MRFCCASHDRVPLSCGRLTPRLVWSHLQQVLALLPQKLLRLQEQGLSPLQEQELLPLQEQNLVLGQLEGPLYWHVYLQKPERLRMVIEMVC